MIEPPALDEDHTKNQYAKHAQQYDFLCAASQWAGPQKLVAAFNKLGLITPQIEIIDCGTGTGLLMKELRQIKEIGSTLNLLGMDFSPEMLEKCREKDVADKLIEQDVTHTWPFVDSSKDLIAATGITEYLST